MNASTVKPGTRIRVSPATVSRYLARAGLMTPEPRKRPKSSYLRFEAELPNESWQADFTHYPLAGGTGTEILTWLDDHSRYVIPQCEACALAAVSGRVGCDSFEECRSQGLHISTHTVNTHLRHVFAKLGVPNQVALAVVAHHSIE